MISLMTKNVVGKFFLTVPLRKDFEKVGLNLSNLFNFAENIISP
jgi:hypothetical protein